MSKRNQGFAIAKEPSMQESIWYGFPAAQTQKR